MIAAVFSVNDDLWDFQAPTVINHCLPVRGERQTEREKSAGGGRCRRGRHKGKQGEREERERGRQRAKDIEGEREDDLSNGEGEEGGIEEACCESGHYMTKDSFPRPGLASAHSQLPPLSACESSSVAPHR